MAVKKQSDIPQPIKTPYAGQAPETAYGTLQTTVLVLIAAFIVRSFVAQPFVVQGRSMEPTFDNQDYLVVDKIEYRIGEPQRGDIIVFKAPEDMTQNYIKRIIGLPGETVKIEKSTISIDGQPLAEGYLPANAFDSSRDATFFLERKLSDNEYLVMGDNRDHSSDSRSWGPLPKANILGRALITVYPFNDFGVISRPSYSLGQ